MLYISFNGRLNKFKYLFNWEFRISYSNETMPAYKDNENE